MIRAVLIDVDDTLLDFRLCAKASMERAAAKAGIDLPDNATEVFFPLNDSLWKQIETGQMTLDELHRTRWKKVFDALGICGDGEAFEVLFRRELAESAEPTHGARRLLEHLHGRYVLGIASNAPYDQQLHRLQLAGFHTYFRHLFVSERIGAAKPSPAFFEACCRALEPIPPHQILMIGDSLRADVRGAKAAGMKTCWLNRRGEKSDEADYTVSSLEEVLGLL